MRTCCRTHVSRPGARIHHLQTSQSYLDDAAVPDAEGLVAVHATASVLQTSGKTWRQSIQPPHTGNNAACASNPCTTGDGEYHKRITPARTKTKDN